MPGMQLDEINEHVKMRDYPMERTIFGGLVIGGTVLVTGLLFFVEIPSQNQQIVPMLLGALTSALGIIVQAVWKTSMTERQQQATISALAASAAAPLSTTTTTTTTKDMDDGPQDSSRDVARDSGVAGPGDGGQPAPSAGPREPPWATASGVGGQG